VKRGYRQLGIAASFTLDICRNMIPTMNLEWCCADFRAHCFQPDGRQDGLGIVFVFHSRIPPMVFLQYHRPNRTPTEPIAEAVIKLKFCPWCGHDLIEQYGSGLPSFHSESSP